MGKGAGILLFMIVLVIPFISAIDINMPSNVSSGQTVIASVQGNFIDPIAKNNIHFYRGYVETSFDYDVAKIGDTYYIYFQTLNKAQNNYSINISGVRYYVGSQVSTATISKPFTVNSQQADFNVNKGFVITYGDFYLTLQNLNPSPITVNIQTATDSGSTSGFFDFLFKNSHVSSGQSITLLSGETQNVYISLDNINETTVRTITLSTNNIAYNIPAYVILQTSQNITTTTNTTITTPVTNTSNTTTIINTTVITNPNTNTTTIITTNTTIITNTTTNTTTTTTVTNTTIITNPNNTTGNYTTNNTNVMVNETKNESSLWDNLVDLFKPQNKTSDTANNTSTTVVINSSGNTSIVVNGTVVVNNTALKTCAELKGSICKVSEEICDGTTVTAKDNLCCIGTCTAKPKSSTGKIIGWSIIGFIIILIIYFKMKLSKTKRSKVDLLRFPGKKF